MSSVDTDDGQSGGPVPFPAGFQDIIQNFNGNRQILTSRLGFADAAQHPSTRKLLFGPPGLGTRNDLNSASLSDFCKVDLGIIQPKELESPDNPAEPEPHKTVRQMSLAALLQDDIKLEPYVGPSTTLSWFETLAQHEIKYRETQKQRNGIIDLAKSIVTSDESKAKFLKAFEESQLSKKQKKKKNKKSKQKENVAPVDDSKSVSQNQPLEKPKSNRSSEESNLDEKQEPQQQNQPSSLQKRPLDVDFPALPKTSGSLDFTTFSNETPKWQKSILSKEDQHLKRTMLSNPQVAHKPSPILSNPQAAHKSSPAKKSSPNEKSAKAPHKRGKSKPIRAAEGGVTTELDHVSTPTPPSMQNSVPVFSANRTPHRDLDTQTRPSDVASCISPNEKQLRVSLPVPEASITSPNLVFPSLEPAFSQALEFEKSPSDDSSQSDYEFPKYDVPKDLKHLRGRRDTVPNPLFEEIRVRSTRAETLPAYELGGERQPIIHHTYASMRQRTRHEELPKRQNLADVQFPCGFVKCEALVFQQEPGSVHCHFCGWISRTRYCCNDHRLLDSEDHYFRCGIQAIVEPARTGIISDDEHVYSAPIMNICGFGNAKRTRQLIHFMHNPQGRYTLFIDSKTAREYSIESPVSLSWDDNPADTRSAPAELVRVLLAICFENNSFDCVVQLAYIFVRLRLGQVFSPETEEMIEQLNAQFALEFAYDVPPGWPWGLHKVLWRGCVPIWEHFWPQLEAIPYKYAAKLADFGKIVNCTSVVG